MKDGWEVKALGEVCIVKRGTTITKKQTIDGEVPVIGGGTKPTYFHNQPNRDANCITISGSGASAGYVNSWTIPIFASDCSTVETRQDTQLQRFVYYYLLSQQNYIYETLRSGAAQPHVYAKDIAALSFPIVRIEEQKRIVSILDEAFEGLDRARENAEANLKSARELFESYLHKVMIQGAEQWESMLMKDVCSLITDGKHGDSKNETDSGYYFLSAKDVKNGKLNYEGARQITKNDFEETHRRTALAPGDVLVTNAGTIGRIAIADGSKVTAKTTFQKSVAVIKPIKELVNSELLAYALEANLLKLMNLSSGTAQKNLLLRDLKQFEMKFPFSLNDQRKIVTKISHYRRKTQGLTDYYATKLQDISDLRQSLLQKAFAGELT